MRLTMHQHWLTGIGVQKIGFWLHTEQVHSLIDEKHTCVTAEFLFKILEMNGEKYV